MRVHDVENKLGITKQTLIYYEKEGLITPLRDKNNYRNYTQNDIDALQIILLLRSLEICIDNIKLIFLGKLSIRDCLNSKQDYLISEKKKIREIEYKIKEYIKRQKVILVSQHDNDEENDYVSLNYSKEMIDYGQNVIKISDIRSIDISLCCSKGENGRYYSLYNLYFVYVDFHTDYDSYSIQIMNNDEVKKFLNFLSSFDVVIKDPLELIKAFNEKKDAVELYKYFNRNFAKWKKVYDLEIKDNYLSIVKKDYIEPLQEIKSQKIPTIREQLVELKRCYINYFKKLIKK